MKIKDKLGIAWLLLTVSVALHILDEAKNDFLPIYNAIARISGTFPVLTYTQWITGMIIMIVILFILSIFAFRNHKWMCYLSFFYGGVIIIHGIGHLAISDYFKEVSAGFYSSFLLFITSIYLIWKALKILRALNLKQPE